MNGTGDGNLPRPLKRASTWGFVATAIGFVVAALNQNEKILPAWLQPWLPMIVGLLMTLALYLKSRENTQVVDTKVNTVADTTADHIDPATSSSDAKVAETLREVAGTGSGS